MPVAQPWTVCGAGVLVTVWLAPFVNDGASLTGDGDDEGLVGALSTPPLAVPPLSWTRTVMVAAPNALAAGV